MEGVTKTAAQIFFQNSLPEVIRKLRSVPSGQEEETIEQLIKETKKEVSSSVQSVKVGAIQKAAYFQMLGYSGSYANFHVVEVMADPFFGNKRIAYMTACALFNENTDVIPLMTALLRRDLCSPNQYECGMALYCIASLCNADLAQDLVVDVVNLLNHPRNYVRKKAILSTYKIFIQYPESLRPTYPKLKEKLEDTSEHSDNDPSVRGAVVCVLCELARRNPANFLGLAVPFYSLLSNIHNNWTLIKVVKVFGYFVPLEPRLGKKLAEPLANLIETSGAKSVQYECLLAVANGMAKVASLTKLTAEKLKLFVEDPDQNLKFLGLQAMSKLVQNNPKHLHDSRDAILNCLNDKDITIRLEAISILTYLVTPKNIVSIVNYVLERCIQNPPDEEWSNEVVLTVIDMCSSDDYSNIDDFEWYFSVLLDLALLPLSSFKHGSLIEMEIVTIAARVNGVRPYAVNSLFEIMTSKQLINADPSTSSQQKILRAAAFVCGEYPHWLVDKYEACKLLLSENVLSLSCEVQVAYIVSAGKIVTYCKQPCKRHVDLYNGEEAVESPVTPQVDDSVTKQVLSFFLGKKDDTSDNVDSSQDSGILEPFRCSVFPEVQEYANLIWNSIFKFSDCSHLLFEKELLVVPEGAQRALEVPVSLALDTAFCENFNSLLELSEEEDSCELSLSEENFDLEYRIEQEKLREKQRREEMDPFYLKEENKPISDSQGNVREAKVPGTTNHISQFRKGKEDSKTKKTFAINRDLARPDNYNENSFRKNNRRHQQDQEVDEATLKLRNIDVTKGLMPGEKLKEALPYSQQLLNKNDPLSSRTSKIKNVFQEKKLWSKNKFSLFVKFGSCKSKNDGIFLKYHVGLSNKGKHNVRNISLGVDHDDNFTGDVLNLMFSETKSDETDVKQTETKGETVELVHELISGSQEQCEWIFQFLKLPETLTRPLFLYLKYSVDDKEIHEKIEFEFNYSDFSRSSVSPVPTTDFLEIVEVALKDAVLLSAFIPCSGNQISESMSSIENKLHLTPIDIFKDSITLLGYVHHNRMQVESKNVTVLIRETREEQERGITISVKNMNKCMSESLILEVVKIIEGTSV